MGVFVLPRVGEREAGAITRAPRAGDAGIGAPLGTWVNRALVHGLDAAVAGCAGGPPGSVVAVWPGGLGESLFDASVRTWMPAGRERLAGAIADAAAWARARGITVALRPHARHVLSDLPSVLSLLGVQKGGAVTSPPPGIGVLLDPMAMLTQRVLHAADEHLERLLSAAAHLSGVVGVVVCNVRRARGEGVPTDIDDGPPLDRVPLHAGEVDAGLIVEMVRRHVPGHVPIVLEAVEDAESVRDLRRQ